MPQRHFLVGLKTLLGLAALAIAANQPAAAQAPPSPACVAAGRVQEQYEGVHRAAQQDLRIYWARRHPRQLAGYQQQLAQAVAQQRAAPEHDRIATDMLMDHLVQPGNSDILKVLSQVEILAQVNGLAQIVPASSQPLAPDPALELRLKQAVALAVPPMRQAQDRVAAAGCYAWMLSAPAVASLQGRQAQEPVALFATTPAAARATSTQADQDTACTAAALSLVDLEKKLGEAYKLRWAIDDTYHDSFFAVVRLRDAFKAGELDDQFEETARLFGLDTSSMSLQQKIAAQPALRKQVSDLMARARALTGRPRDKWIDPDAAGLEDMLLDDEDEEKPPVDPAVRAKELEIEDNWVRAEALTLQGRNRLAALRCEDMPTPPPSDVGGPMRRLVTILRQSIRGTSGSDVTSSYEDTYSETSTRHDRQRSGVSFDLKTWAFSGMPGSLAPGQTFTIYITGKHTVVSDFAPAAFNEFASIKASFGLEVISARKAVLLKRVVTDGQYVFKVPANAKSVVFDLYDADNSTDPAYNAGDPFVRYCYGDCSP